ncbi:gamma-glutamyltransferase [Leptolyngbya sp. FACHB-17]|uniref:gamma-glutamyltransferase n=1 Tax=unclassified Leptolyngbya TaxID=2650499 RepID=UPI0016816CE2|nr:gamma-glutamyltransferase [Leptolyngbya sp. FACHB-17]MBD2080430.1 gamma-glutamyltransferase [Leptolyngbya sp. FACHB-17]
MPLKIQGAIAAGHAKTVEAGLEMFRLGGNVFDAVVAAVMASFVTEPTLTSPAGGGFLLAHTQTGENVLFDFFTQTPCQKRPRDTVDFYPTQVKFGNVLQEFHIGLGSIAVPGTIGGLLHVHRRLGRLPLAWVAEPAIHYAKTGVEITAFQSYCYQILAPILLNNPGSRQVFTVQGALPQPGALMTMPDLAETLSYLAAEGADGFYRGEIAHQLVKDCQAQGGYLTLADLYHYQVIERQPLTTRYRGRTFLTNPPPSSGGALIAFALALLEDIDLSMLKFGSTEQVRLLARVIQLTNRARADGFDANLYQADVAKQFLAADHLATYAQQLNAHPINKWGSTTHLSAIDSEGNAASVTTSNGEGSGYVIPGTGIMTNNMLGEVDLHPHGFHNWQENVRISSMMAPTMILRQQKPEIVLGSGGSNRIRTAILQVISNLLDFKMSVEQAVNSPRIHWEDGVLNLEPIAESLVIDRSIFPFDQVLELWQQQNMFFGGVHAVTRSQSGEFSGASDPRRDGAVGILI